MTKIKSLFMTLLLTLGVSSAIAGSHGSTLDIVKERGFLKCGSNTGLAGFGLPNDDGVWEGIDVDVCRAVAAAVFGDASKVEYVPTTSKVRFTVLQSGEVDMLSRNTTWTLQRDVELGLEFVGVNYYDGQGFMVPASLGVSSATELDGASVCIQVGTTTEMNLADFFSANGMSYEAVPVETNSEADAAYTAGRCDVYTTDASGLYASRAGYPDPSAHVVLPEIVSKEPLGPSVRHGDSAWADIVRWSLNAMIIGEELGITSANVDEMKSSKNPEVLRLLGVNQVGDTGAGYGQWLNLSDDWAYNIIQQVGNYSESFERHIGPNTPINIQRGLNALYKDGGILYAPPFR
ncbi:amino acid ABC transporter substrate-binding protein [Alphaproteobacteria bacterium]|nr:amino acid ABC transporter substrate-binding protein [Alphaproteobacteria bacterium]MDB3973937.1 amino acid ABC transporter substrate-binding protein [Alphaproteobacteria bacterium]